MSKKQSAVAEKDDAALLEELAAFKTALKQRLQSVIIGQDAILDQLLIALFARGHVLLTGVPGLAKTLMVRTLAELLDRKFSRIQFTPDLMPADIVGTDVLQEDRVGGRRSMTFLPGPLFANIVLADEINRTPPKTQSALLEAMQERQITSGGKTYRLENPFFVLATRNPIEQEGTYPLPDAQLDRFLFCCQIDYPENVADEVEIVLKTTGGAGTPITPPSGTDRLTAYQDLVRRVPVSRTVAEYAVTLVRRTRPGDPGAPKAVREYVDWGAGPRAAQGLILAGKAMAALNGRPAVGFVEVREMLMPVLRHRVVLNYMAQTAKIGMDEIIAAIVKETH